MPTKEVQHYVFESSEDATAAVDGSKVLADGDVLLVPSESAAAVLVNATPYAVTAMRGAFEELSAAADWRTMDDGFYVDAVRHAQHLAEHPPPVGAPVVFDAAYNPQPARCVCGWDADGTMEVANRYAEDAPPGPVGIAGMDSWNYVRSSSWDPENGMGHGDCPVCGAEVLAETVVAR